MDSPTIPLTFRPWSWRWFLFSHAVSIGNSGLPICPRYWVFE
jgi:hypothetical protein